MNSQELEDRNTSSFSLFLFSTVFVCLFVFLLVSGDSVSLCNPGYPRTSSLDQTSLEFKDLPASASECWD